jgi:hypothetical protein
MTAEQDGGYGKAGIRFIGLFYSNSKSKRHLRWLVFGSSTYYTVRLRRLNPRRLDVIFDLKPELH